MDMASSRVKQSRGRGGRLIYIQHLPAAMLAATALHSYIHPYKEKQTKKVVEVINISRDYFVFFFVLMNLIR